MESFKVIQDLKDGNLPPVKVKVEPETFVLLAVSLIVVIATYFIIKKIV